MKKDSVSLLLAFLCGFIFVFLFYRESFGLNILIFECLLISFALIFNKIKAFTFNLYLVGFGTFISMLGVLFYNNAYVIIFNFLSFLLFSVLFNEPHLKSFFNVVKILPNNILSAFLKIIYFPLILFPDKPIIKRLYRITKIIIFPLLVIIFFIFLYEAGNSIFAGYIDRLISYIIDFINQIFANINLLQIFLFVSGAIIAILYLLSRANKTIVCKDQNSSDLLIRNRVRSLSKRKTKFTDLLNEYKSGVFLLVCLNLLIAIINAIDIYWVWFNFEWDGSYLKEFVHEGTYILIIAILFSILIVLFFFRANLNFYSKNKTLILLSYLWLIQNGIMTLSVAIRNIWYIKFNNLAYLRLFVFAFLILTLFGLLTVFIKIRYKKSEYFIFRKNSLAAYLMLCLLTLINWDNFIAKYNISNSKKAYFHYDFMVTMPDRVLPVLFDNYYLFEKEFNKKDYHEYVFNEFNINDSIKNYKQLLEIKKRRFISNYEKRNWRSWNYADFKAYHSVIGNKK